MQKPRIYADFNKWTQCNNEYWLILDCKGTHDDLKRLNLQLHVGLEAIFYTDDANDDGSLNELEADGIVRFDSNRFGWVAVIDQEKIRHARDKD